MFHIKITYKDLTAAEVVFRFPRDFLTVLISNLDSWRKTLPMLSTSDSHGCERSVLLRTVAKKSYKSLKAAYYLISCMMIFLVFMPFTLTQAFADKIYVVERERGSLAVIENDHIVKEIGELGNLNHATVKFNKGFAYIISRDGYLSQIDTGTDKLLRKVKAGNSGIGFTFLNDFIAVANYDPHDVVILDTNLNVLKKNDTGSRNVGIKATDRLLLFSLMDKDEIHVLDSRNGFGIHKIIKDVGSVPFDALLSGDKYIVGFFNEGSVGILDINTMKFSKEALRKGEGEAVFKIPHFGIWGVYGNTAFIPAVGERRLYIIDLDTFKYREHINLIGLPVFVAVSPDNRYIAVNYSGDKEDFVTIIDAKNRKVLRDIKAGRRIMHLRFSWNSRRLYLSSYFDNTLKILDATNWGTLKEITVPTPSGIFILRQ